MAGDLQDQQRHRCTRHREREAQRHPAGIGLDRSIHEIADVGECEELGHQRPHFRVRQAEDRAIEKHVLTSADAGWDECAETFHQLGRQPIRFADANGTNN